jgi:hypothetical protein
MWRARVITDNKMTFIDQPGFENFSKIFSMGGT